jgi:hypothetical protein
MALKSIRALVFCLATALLTSGAVGEEPNGSPPIESPSGISVTLTPFSGWVPGFDGKIVGPQGNSVSLSVSPIDVIKNVDELIDVLDGIYIGWGEIRHRRFGLFFDVFHLEISSFASIDRRFVSGSVDVAFRQSTGTIAGTYRVWQAAHGHIDAMAGVRISDISGHVGLTLNNFSATREGGDTWTDGIFGVKGQYKLDPKWSLTGWGLIGGGASDITWDLYGALTYAVRPGFDLSVGFRGLKIDYSTDDFTWDVLQYGPVVNATFQF